MKKITPDEINLIGKWVFDGKNIEADETCKRIEWLVDQVLTEVAVSPNYGAWETLFLDDDGRYWEKIYPQGEMQGGGPPALEKISHDDAHRKYELCEKL